MTHRIFALMLTCALLGCPETGDFDFDGDGWPDNNDCDPENELIYPDAEESCTDGVDNDCDHAIDSEDYDCDSDGDGFPDPLDCDDDDPEVHPDAEEVCDGVDNDCDGSIDGAYATGATAWYEDADGDGFGDPVSTAVACDPPDNSWLADDTDCDDTDPDVYPDAVEACNAVDDDCDGSVDEDFDADGDGVTTCGPDGTEGTADDDCEDQDAAVYPGSGC